jgi:hypothetical protein
VPCALPKEYRKSLRCALYIGCAVSVHHKGCGKVWGARYTLDACYLPKNTVYIKSVNHIEKFVPTV